MKNKQLNLYFNQIPSDENNKIQKDLRSNFILSLFLIFFLLIFLRLIFLGFDKVNLLELKTNENFFYERKDIVDINNTILAKNVGSYDLILRKVKVKNLDSILLKIKILFPDIKINNIKFEYQTKAIIVLKKNLSPTDYNKVIALGEPSLELAKREIRIYPQQNLFSHIIGRVDTDNKGISGIEMFLDEQLRNKSNLSNPIKLSLNANIQYLIYEELEKGVKDFSALGAAAILMNAQTGKVVSIVSLPDVDGNKRYQAESKNYLNKATKSLYELGSVFKTFTIASAIENKLITKNTVFSNLRQRVYCGKFPIDEYRWDKSKANLTVEQILVKSSNIGTIEIIKKNGLENHQKFIENLEIFEMPKLEIMELSKSNKNRWGMCNTFTSGFGHGVSTTLLQLTRAYAGIVNGGELPETSILFDSPVKKKRIISNETSRIMNEILRANVDRKNPTEGSGRKADIDGYDVMGKTGTAQKASEVEKGYSTEIVNVFASAFPYRNPKYVLTILIDEPKGAPQIWKHSRREAGWNAVYIAGRIIQKIGPSLAINNLEFREENGRKTKNN